MKILFVSTYYNAPHFMEIQLKSLQTFVEDDFELIIMDDSDHTTTSLLSGKLAREEIYNESKRLNLKYVAVPQDIHASISNGGLVPNGLPAGHPTERHRAHLHWIFKNHKLLGFNKYDVFVLIESDIFIKKPINIKNYMKDFDLMGPGRTNFHAIKTNDINQIWPEEINHLNEIIFDFFPMYMLLINMNTVKNLETINIGGFAGTDTGGQTGLFIKNNPNYKYCFMGIGNDKNYQIDFFSKNLQSTDNDSEFVHYRGGSNWDYQSVEYYSEKLNRLLKKFIPILTFNLPEQKYNLSSRDKEHIFFKDDK